MSNLNHGKFISSLILSVMSWTYLSGEISKVKRLVKIKTVLMCGWPENFGLADFVSRGSPQIEIRALAQRQEFMLHRCLELWSYEILNFREETFVCVVVLALNIFYGPNSSEEKLPEQRKSSKFETWRRTDADRKHKKFLSTPRFFVRQKQVDYKVNHSKWVTWESCSFALQRLFW